MSTNPFQAEPHDDDRASGNNAVSSFWHESSGSRAPKFEALQALLAFSSLQEQIRQRRRADPNFAVNAASSWKAEPFVFDEVLQLVAERALSITGSDGIAIALMDGEEFVCRASAGSAAPPHGAVIDAKSGFSGSCLRARDIVRCDDSENDPRVNVEICRRLGTRSMVALPLLDGERVVGLVEAFSGIPYGFADSDIRSLNLLAELILASMKPEEPLAQTVLNVASSTEVEEPESAPEEIVSADVAPMPTVEEVEPESQVEEPNAEQYEATPEEQGTILSEYNDPPSSSGIAIVMLILMVAVGVGLGVWWKMHPKMRFVPPRQEYINPGPSPEASQAATPSDIELSEPKVPEPETSGKPSMLTGIRHWTSKTSSTVVIDLQDHVQYEAHRLSNPERIYFDLHNTNMSPGVNHTFPIDDSQLVRVRAAQPKEGITRVVLETKGAPSFSVSLESSPYRLVIEVEPAGTSAPKATSGLFSPVAPQEMVWLPRTVQPEVRRRPTAPAPRFVIALDAGHGGWDLGTVGRSGLQEKELVLDIVARLGRIIQQRLNAEIIFTREDDSYIPLEKRAELANTARADLFLSVHANYSDLTSAQGIETYYTNTYASTEAKLQNIAASPLDLRPPKGVDLRQKTALSRRLAEEIQRSLFHTLSGSYPTLRDRGVKQASYVVLTGTNMPAVLAEVSFVSSPSDEAHLRTPAYRQEIAEAIYKGVSGFRSESRRVTTMAKNMGRPSGK